MLAIVFGILGGAVHLLAFPIYYRQMLQGKQQPNVATWSIWVVWSALNAISYLVMSGDVVKIIVPATAASACLAMLVFALFKGKLSRPDVSDLSALVIGILAVFGWYYYRSATVGNLLLQISLVISFFPTYRDAWKKPDKKRVLPWWLWSSSYAFIIATIFLRWQNQPQVLVYPLLGMSLYAVVALINLKHAS